MPSTNIRPTPKLGLLANWQQFTLLVLVNSFVGTMVGTERSLLPLLAEHGFGLKSRVAILSFLVSFGLVKAGANLFAGRWSDRLGRKPVLLAGWLAGLPVPVLIYFAPAWSWVVAANVFLGMNQGLAWSTTVNMKIDLVGPKRRGLAMGINEASGYVAVSLAALGAGYLSAVYGPRMSMLVIGESAALYPAVWGLGQLGTGALSDRIGRKMLIVSGMLLQGIAILLLTILNGFTGWAWASVLLGLGTAMVYPTFLAAISDVAQPSWRASAVGVYRLWRDSGYAIGAILAGVLADAFGTRRAIATVGGLTVFTGLLVALVMRETLAQRNSPINSLQSVTGEKRDSL